MSTEEHIIEEKEPSSFRLIMTLGIAGFLSGLILVSVYLYTKPFIAQNKAEALRKAVFEVLPGTARFEAMRWNGNKIIPAGDKLNDADEMVYFGYDSMQNLTGIAIPGEESGYQDVISALAGYDPDEKIIIGLKVLDSKETPGLGDKILFDKDFQSNFTNLSIEPEITVVKKGDKIAENQIQAITGATISSKAIGRLLQKSMSVWRERIEAYRSSQQVMRSENESN